MFILYREEQGGQLDYDSYVPEKVKAINNTQAIYFRVNGYDIPIGFEAYKINGYNYFSLRDIGDTLGFYVGYDSGSRTVLVDTNRSAEFSQNQLERKIETMIKYGISLVGKVSYEEADCSQFVGGILDFAGINLQVPPWTWTIGSSPALEEIPMSEIKRGDILNRSDRPNQHVMIYIGDGKILESVPKHGVRITKLRTEGFTAYRLISY